VTFNFKESFGEENYQKEIKKLIDVTIPTSLERFDEIVAKNNGYFVNGKLTWVDLYFASLADYFHGIFNWTGLKIDGNFVDKYENLKSLKEKVLAIESIKNWVDKRPDTTA
jgi:glutathione S-transferase